MTSLKLSIIVPAYNEAARLGPSLRTIVDYLKQQRDQSEVIVVDDGSTDNTATVAEESLADSGAVATRVIRYDENRGKGYAARTGLLAARANIALFSDADLSTPITEAPKLIEPIRTAHSQFDLILNPQRHLAHSRLQEHDALSYAEPASKVAVMRDSLRM